jgi:ammonia channel protein AmtB
MNPLPYSHAIWHTIDFAGGTVVHIRWIPLIIFIAIASFMMIWLRRRKR